MESSCGQIPWTFLTREMNTWWGGLHAKAPSPASAPSRRCASHREERLLTVHAACFPCFLVDDVFGGELLLCSGCCHDPVRWNRGFRFVLQRGLACMPITFCVFGTKLPMGIKCFLEACSLLCRVTVAT